MKLLISAFLVFGVVLGIAGPLQAQDYAQLVSTLGSQGPFQSEVEHLLYSKLNNFRASRGLPRFGTDDRFTQAARAHSADMARRNYLGHVSADGLDFSARMKALHGGKLNFSTIGENAVMMYPVRSAGVVADTLFKSWLNSPPHLRNMLRTDFVSVATGAVYLGNKAYADQIFLGSPVAPEVSGRCSQPCVTWH